MVRKALHPLALWDAPFLPAPTENALPLSAGTKLPFPLRKKLAAQLAAGVAFVLEQGFYPDKALLRSSRFVRSKGGVWWQLSAFPRWTLDDPRLSRALALGRRGERLPWLLLFPFLAQLLPELRGFWGEQAESEDPWAFPKVFLQELVGKDRAGKSLDHPLGWGRFLWARRFVLPEEGGLFFLDDPYLAERLSRFAGVTAGSFTEEDLAPRQAQALMADHGGVVITTTALPGVAALPLAEKEPWWCLLPVGEEERAAGFLAGASSGDSITVGLSLTHAVASAWGLGEDRRGEGRRWLSYPAEKLASVLERSGLGLSAEEAAVVAGGREALEELRRLQLVVHRFGRWFASQSQGVNPGELERWRQHFPEGPLRWALEAARGGSAAQLVAWCEEVLNQAKGELILGLAPLAAVVPELRVPLVEAALTSGWLSYAEPWLDSCPAPYGPLFQVWWALACGDKNTLFKAQRAFSSLTEGKLPPRLSARALLLAAWLAEQQGDHQRARELGRTVLALPDLQSELLAEAAYLVGEGSLERLAHSPRLGALGRQRLYHLLGIQAMHRGDTPAAERNFRQALQGASGRNPLRFGELLADAGAVAMLLDKPVQAEKFYAAAEFWLSLAGSRRASRLVSFNRAVLANDRLQWEKAQKLLAAAFDESHATPVDRAFFLVEWARSFLAQGHFEKASEIAAQLEALVAGLPENHNVQQGLAVIKAHLALALGDLSEAWEASQRAEVSERRLLLALWESRQGLLPADELPNRWGLALAARLLALAKSSLSQAQAEAKKALAAERPENALGLARALLLSPAWGVELPALLKELLPRLKAQLRAFGLERWVFLLEKQWGRDWPEILQLVARLGERGAESWKAPEWQTLVPMLGLSGLKVIGQGQELLRIGSTRDGKSEHFGPFEVKLSGAVDDEVLAVLRLTLQRAPLPALPPSSADPLGLTGASPQIVSLREDIARYAPLPITVLILGEPGTGKERVARALHRLSGRSGEFVPVNCAGLPESLLEAELFGVVRGAFTGADRDRPGLVEQAEGGTLFLDEIGELPASMQAKLLRVLQEREVRRVGGTRARKVDVRFVAATNRDLKQAVALGQFRRDLFDRLATVTLKVPPLRERPQDIPALVGELVAHYASQFGLGPVTLAPDFMARLQAYPWPGNVRELEAVVVQALLRCPRGAALAAEHLPRELWAAPAGRDEQAIPPLEEAERAFYREYFQHLLRHTGGNRTRAAKIAGLSRQALLYRLRQVGLAESRGED
ncbi:hypothetical protein EG19_09905 [Thermoanaerobaculum aquaticum]|uniref:Sigma-54 factor interaction domain-containing protein n=1 Tax=Thermoanaerobaculum aquaticum TaxID=1312852 RepID=A0A062XV29_9BACT|nr:sigma 54-interacting transcriptional regulator [Thermoanaerobaculum aquaticum]KDA54728.1 hypothetical protein EG19_09905 [Thermoanaerobaculum aquaticum]